MVRITKVLGFGEIPPPYGKNSQKIPYFFSDRLPNLNVAHFLLLIMQDTAAHL